MPPQTRSCSASRKLFCLLQRIVALTLSLLLPGLSLPLHAATPASSGESHAHRNHSLPQRLVVTSPGFGDFHSRKEVPVSIHLDKKEDPTSLHVVLNGKDVSHRLHFGPCADGGYVLEGSVRLQDGLRKGQNLLFAEVRDEARKWVGASQRVTFAYAPEESGSGVTPNTNTILYYEPASVGISTVPNGGNGGAWVQLTTGNQANVMDTALQTIPGSSNVSVAFPDASLSINCQGSIFQAIILNRIEPSDPPEATVCANSEAAMETAAATDLGRALDASDLIIFGTTPGQYANNAPPDTSPIGGTNYTDAAHQSMQLAYYDIIGVKGATPGTAHENYSQATITSGRPYQSVSFLQGTLVEDGNSNYNYIPSGEQQFQMVSGANPSFTVGAQSYQMPSGSSAGAFWLLVLDRAQLHPVNLSGGSWTNCSYNLSSSQTCGGVFDVQADGGAALATTLAAVDPQNLVILATAGCPFTNTAQINTYFSDVIQFYGAPKYSLQSLTTGGNCTWSMVTQNEQKTSLSPGIAFSANQFIAQQQTGSTNGYLARDNNGFYNVTMAGQMLPGTSGSAPTIAVDYTFEQTASNQREDWPLTDTPGHLAAYHDISQQLLSSFGETGSYIYDVRYFYTNIPKATKVSALTTTALQQSSWDTATPQEFLDAQSEIGMELQTLSSALGYLTGSSGVQGILFATNNNILVEAFQVAGAIGSDQDQAAQQIVNANSSDILNYAAGITSLAAAISSPLLPEVGVFMGVISGALWTGSAGVSPLSGTLPGPESVYDEELNVIINDAGGSATNITTGFDKALDNIFSDNAKFEAIGTLTSNSDSNWNVPTIVTGDGISASISAGEARTLWLQVLPGLFGIRSKQNAASSNPASFGSLTFGNEGGKGACTSVYSSLNSGPVAASSQIAFPSFGNNAQYDVSFLALGPNPTQPQVEDNDLTDSPASSALSTLLTTDQIMTINGVQQPVINFPPMMLFTSSPIPTQAPLYFSINQLCNAPIE